MQIFCAATLLATAPPLSANRGRVWQHALHTTCHTPILTCTVHTMLTASHCHPGSTPSPNSAAHIMPPTTPQCSPRYPSCRREQLSSHAHNPPATLPQPSHNPCNTQSSTASIPLLSFSLPVTPQSSKSELSSSSSRPPSAFLSTMRATSARICTDRGWRCGRVSTQVSQQARGRCTQGVTCPRGVDK